MLKKALMVALILGFVFSLIGVTELAYAEESKQSDSDEQTTTQPAKKCKAGCEKACCKKPTATQPAKKCEADCEKACCKDKKSPKAE